jgi:hypothetical protein
MSSNCVADIPSTSSSMEMFVNSSTSSTMSFCLLTLHTCRIIVSCAVCRSGAKGLTDDGRGSLLALEPEFAERILELLRDIYHMRLGWLYVSSGVPSNINFTDHVASRVRGGCTKAITAGARAFFDGRSFVAQQLVAPWTRPERSGQ